MPKILGFRGRDADVRRCTFCNIDAVVIRRQFLLSREICVLDCSHTCAYLREGEDPTVYTQGQEKVCPICDDPYRTFTDDATGWFCYDCRTTFGVRTIIEAKQLFDEMGQVPPGKRQEMKEESMRKRTRYQPGGTGTALVPKPQVDKEKVAEAIRGMVEYGRLAHDRSPLRQPTAYVIAKNGMFEVRHSDVADIVFQPKEVMGITTELKAGISLNIPKVPYKLLAQTVAFFRETCREQKGSSEAIVQVWFNTVEKAYHIHVPTQRVSGGSVNHDSSFDREGERVEGTGQSVWIHVMDIHSHGSSMGGFWSSTDDGDERKAPEGRMFGVIGKVNQPLPDWRWRMRTREGFIDLKFDDIFEVLLTEKVPFTVTWDVILGAAGEKDGVNADGTVNLKCPVDPFKDATCPKEWQEKVTGSSYGHGSMYGLGGSGSAYQARAIPSYIYIRSKDNTTLDEYDVEGGGVPKPTGKKILLRREEVK